MTEALLRVDHLVKRFGGFAATDGASLQVAQGSLHALIGPNGAGKTTLIHQISGALKPDAGHVHFDGQDITRLPMHQRARRGLLRSYQITSIFGQLSVLDNLALAVQAASGSSMRFWRPARSEASRYEEAAAVAERVGLGGQLQLAGAALSHGQQRQLELGLVLAAKPRLLLLDEPLAGMGPDESARMVTLLQSLRGEQTTLLVEHDMDAVFKLADKVSVLVFGKVIATGTPAEIKANAEVRRAYLGEEGEVCEPGAESARTTQEAKA